MDRLRSLVNHLREMLDNDSVYGAVKDPAREEIRAGEVKARRVRLRKRDASCG